MKKISHITILYLSVLVLYNCSNEKDITQELEYKNEVQKDTSNDRYVLMTYDKYIIPVGRMEGTVLMDSYISYFYQMPKGENISNIIAYNTLKGHIGKNGGSLLQSNNKLYHNSNSATFNRVEAVANRIYNTPERLVFPEEGIIREQVYKDLDNRAVSLMYKNFTVTNELGFLCLPLYNPTVLTFDPNSMFKLTPKFSLSKKPKNSWGNEKFDVDYVLEEILKITPELEGITFPNVLLGINFCQWHNGKLLLDIMFYDENKINVSPDVYILAVDIKGTGKWETVSAIKDSGFIESNTESQQSFHNEKGDLYIVTKGKDEVGFYRNSKISRIKSDAVTVDKDWVIDIKEVTTTANPVRFNGIYVANDKIITMINNASLTSTTKDMDLENVWDYYVIDINTKEAKKIDGLQSCSGFVSGANLVSKIDGKYYIRYVRTGDDAPYNGYYEYNFNTNKATSAFNVTEGGYVLDFKKITLSK